MAFIHCDNVVQQVSSAAFDPTLRNPVLPGTLEGGAERAYFQGSNGRGNLQPVFRIPVEDQKPGRRVEGKRLPELLNNPQLRRARKQRRMDARRSPITFSMASCYRKLAVDDKNPCC